MRLVDSTGERFGRLIVISRVYRKGPVSWLCKCDCGNETVVVGTKLRFGWTKSCGCLKIEKTIERNTTHGYVKGGYTPEYNTWTGMINRCENKNNPKYNIYGKRGISICKRWREDFGMFMEDMGTKPSSNYSIDRIDVNGNYEPSNCRWATPVEQMNNIRKNRSLTAFGETKTIANWSRDERCSVGRRLLSARIVKLGWEPEKAITQKSKRSAH